MCGGSSGGATSGGTSIPLGIDANVSGAERPDVCRESGGGADDDRCPPQERPKEPRQTPGELDVRSPRLQDERLPRGEPRNGRREPVRVDDVCIPRCATRLPREREEKEREEDRPPRLRLEVVGDPVAVGDPEVTERGWRDDVDVDSGPTQVLDRVLDEQPGDVARRARIRRRQDADPHVDQRRRPNTAGAAIASIAKTKK